MSDMLSSPRTSADSGRTVNNKPRTHEPIIGHMTDNSVRHHNVINDGYFVIKQLKNTLKVTFILNLNVNLWH